ncbi:MAG: DNA polymerase III subunit delta [Candidatus Neomarinimicrobiota bacterium]
MKLKQAIFEINRNVIHPVYLLKGNDHYIQSFFIDHLTLKYFGNSKVQKMLMLPDDMSGKEMIDKITTIDLFSTKKIFMIRSPQKIKGKASLDLLEICKKPILDNIIILINDDWSNRSSFLNKVEGLIDPIDVQTPFAKDMKKWASYLIKQKGKISNSYVEEYFVNMAGDSVGHLENEIEKVCLLIGERKNIEIDDIEKFSGWIRQRQRWEFLLALGGKEYSKAINLGKNIITNNDSMLTLLIPIFTLFQELLFYKIKDGTIDKYGSYIPIPASVKRRIPIFAGLFKLEEIQIALKMLAEIDKRQKTEYSNDETELIQFISNVIK